MQTTTKYKLKCPKCGQEGILEEIERYEVPEEAAPGDCADDMTIYYYEFKVSSGEFTVFHRDPNQYEHKTICNRCKVEATETRIKSKA